MRWWYGVGAGLVLAAGPVTLQGAPDDIDANAVYKKCVGSCVLVSTSVKDGRVEGTGVLIHAEKRLVLTCAHVVEEENTTVQFPIRTKDSEVVNDTKEYVKRLTAGDVIKAKVLHRDEGRDLALLQLESLPAEARAVPLAAESSKPGTPVVIIFNPPRVDFRFATIQCKVRHVGEEELVFAHRDKTAAKKVRVVTMTNPVGFGLDSGSPVLDVRGDLAAVQGYGYRGAGLMNVNAAIDVTEVRACLSAAKVELPEPAKAGPGK